METSSLAGFPIQNSDVGNRKECYGYNRIVSDTVHNGILRVDDGLQIIGVEDGGFEDGCAVVQVDDQNNMLMWILRIVGLLLVVFGVKSMFSLLPTLFKVLPFLGNIVDAGVGLVCWIFGLAWSLIVITIA